MYKYFSERTMTFSVTQHIWFNFFRGNRCIYHDNRFLSMFMKITFMLLNFTNLAGNAPVHDLNCLNIIIQHEWVASQPIYSCTSVEQLHVKLTYQSGILAHLYVGGFLVI